MLKPSFVPQRANLGQQVYQHLLDKIYKMEIQPGTQLGIGEIADQLGVSRSPVRDACLMLMADGVVELLPSGGYRVIKLDRRYIDDVFVVRHALELAAVRLSVQQLDRERVRQLRETWARFQVVDANATTDPDFLERHISADQDLHQCIAEMSRNRLLKDALDKIVGIAALIRRWHYSSKIPQGQLVLTAEEHLKMLDAMIAGDADGAVAALDEHLTSAHARTLDRLDAAGKEVPR